MLRHEGGMHKHWAVQTVLWSRSRWLAGILWRMRSDGQIGHRLRDKLLEVDQTHGNNVSLLRSPPVILNAFATAFPTLTMSSECRADLLEDALPVSVGTFVELLAGADLHLTLQ